MIGGALLLALVLVFVIPVLVIISGLVVAAILGWALKDDAEQRFEGSELLDLS